MYTLEKALLATVFAIVATIGGCSYATNAEDNRAIYSLVEQGQTAEQAYCAIRGTNQNIACQVLITKQTERGE